MIHHNCFLLTFPLFPAWVLPTVLGNWSREGGFQVEKKDRVAPSELPARLPLQAHD